MTNRDRRKINRIAYREKIGYISPAKRKEFKEAAGIPTRPMNSDEREYLSKLLKYGHLTGEDISTELKLLAG